MNKVNCFLSRWIMIWKIGVNLEADFCFDVVDLSLICMGTETEE